MLPFRNDPNTLSESPEFTLHPKCIYLSGEYYETSYSVTLRILFILKNEC